MRWLALLITSSACLAASVAPLPEITTGMSDQPVEISETPWYSGFVSTSVAILVGEVGEVSSDVQTTPQQVWLSETCAVRVEAAFGHLKQIDGIKLARLTSSNEGSPYEPVDPAWGRLRHLKKGQKILLLLHDHEGPCFGFEALIELTETTRTLPDILRRTACEPLQFTDEDLQVLEAGSSLLHDQLVEIRALRQEIHEEESTKRSQTVTRIAAAGVAVIIVVLVGWRLLRRPRPQNPTT